MATLVKVDYKYTITRKNDAGKEICQQFVSGTIGPTAMTDELCADLIAFTKATTSVGTLIDEGS